MAGETLPSGSTNTQGLADWAAPYITNYLSKAQALSETPYQTYQGPLTAGASNLQNKVFQGLAGLTFPSNLGQSFASPVGQPQAPRAGAGGINYFGGPQVSQPPMGDQPAVMPQQGGFPQVQQPPMGNFGGPQVQQPPMGDYTGGPGIQPPPQVSPQPMGPNEGGIAGLTPPQASMQPSNIAQTYMNPYLQSVLDPQLAELRRQNDITNMATNAKLTGSGAFGGSRQAIMNAENNRNLMQEQNKTVGQGYASAYDKAMQQFNTEQGQAKDLANLMSGQGAIERGITAEGVAADKEEFEKQRQYPFQQVQWQRDMISGLPTGSVTNTAGQMSGVGSFLNALGGGTAAASALGYKNVGELLKGLGLDLGAP